MLQVIAITGMADRHQLDQSIAITGIRTDAPAPVAVTRDTVPPRPPSDGGAKPRNTRRATLLAAAGLAAALAAGWVYVPSLYSVATDDAYVAADIVSVVPKVSAYVTNLRVDDNTPFQARQLLVELDPRDYQVAVDSALADLRGAEAGKANVQAQLEEQGRVIAADQAAVDGGTATLTFAGSSSRATATWPVPASAPGNGLSAHSDDCSHRFRSKPAACSDRSEPGIPMIPAG